MAHLENPDFYWEATPENQKREGQSELCKKNLQAKKQV